MDFNGETVLDELNDFGKQSSEISPVLEEYLVKIAKSGDTMFPWNKLKPVFKRKLELVLTDFYESCPTDNLPPLPNVEDFKYDILKEKILETVDSFENAPFTIQRLCELVTDPRRHYKRTDKFMRGVEKNILVVSTVEPRSPFRNDIYNNNVSQIVNGLISTTASGPHGHVTTNDDNSNVSSSSVTTVITAPKSTNDNVPLDNFADAFSSVPCTTVSTGTDSCMTGVPHDSAGENCSSVKSFNSHESSTDAMKEAELSKNKEVHIRDNAMDTSRDHSEHPSHMINVYHSEKHVDSSSETIQNSICESTGDHAFPDVPSAQLSQEEEPSSSDTSDVYVFHSRATETEETGIDDSAVEPAGTEDEATSSKSVLGKESSEAEEKEENQQPGSTVSSSHTELDPSVAEPDSEC